MSYYDGLRDGRNPWLGTNRPNDSSASDYDRGYREARAKRMGEMIWGTSLSTPKQTDYVPREYTIVDEIMLQFCRLIGLALLCTFIPGVLAYIVFFAIVAFSVALYLFQKLKEKKLEEKRAAEELAKSKIDHYARIEQYKRENEKNGFKLVNGKGEKISPLALDPPKKKEYKGTRRLIIIALIMLAFLILRIAL